jgi:hypothetical protein
VAEALARSLLFVGMARGRADERGFAAIRRLRRAHAGARQLSLAAFKQLIREQYFMLLIDEKAALAALPALLPQEMEDRRAAFEALGEVLRATGQLSGDAAERLTRVAALFGLGNAPVPFIPRATTGQKAS